MLSWINAHCGREAFMSVVSFDDSVLDRMVQAVELVRNRLKRAAHALEIAAVPYAVVGGNAVAAWVAKIDPAAVRNTQDVDMILARADFESAKTALSKAGFVYRHVKGIDMFLDGPGARVRDAVHILFAGEKVRAEDLAPTASLAESESTPTTATGTFRVVSLEALVRMKLTSYRDKDRTHLRDLIDVGLLDSSWPARFPTELGARLQALLDDPNG
jgi:hypothetical protein